MSVFNLKGLNPYFTETKCAVSYIFKRRALEKMGLSKMTSETFDIGIRLWLARKGIKNQHDIERIEHFAGSLSVGLLMVLRTLPRPPRGQGRAEYGLIGLKRNSHREPMDPEAFLMVQKHVQGLLKDLNANNGNVLSCVPNHVSKHLTGPEKYPEMPRKRKHSLVTRY